MVLTGGCPLGILGSGFTTLILKSLYFIYQTIFSWNFDVVCLRSYGCTTK